MKNIYIYIYIYIYNENKLDPIVLKLSFNIPCLPFNTNKRIHKQKHSQIKEYGKKILNVMNHIKLLTSLDVLSRMKIMELKLNCLSR